MQHNRAGRKLRRTTSHRKALFRNQLSSLITHERIQTTISKAKELRPLVEKMVTLGKRGDLPARRLALKTLPEPETVRRLFDEIAPRFTTRAGGYTRIMKLGQRPGDAAEVAIIEFVDYDFGKKRAAKVASQKDASEKKETLLDKARKLVTGRGSAPKAEGDSGDAQAPTGDAGEPATEPKAPKAPKEPKEKPARNAVPRKGHDEAGKSKAPKGSGGAKKGPAKGTTPRKAV